MGLDEHKQQGRGALAFAVITVSDTRRGDQDLGGAYLVEAFEKAGHRVVHRQWVPDEANAIAEALRQALEADSNEGRAQVIVFTGGTGFAPRDVTVPTLMERFDVPVPGFGELFRALSYQQIASAAILSQACAGICSGRLVVALPGSLKALSLAVERILLPEAGHFVSQLEGPA